MDNQATVFVGMKHIAWWEKFYGDCSMDEEIYQETVFPFATGMDISMKWDDVVVKFRYKGAAWVYINIELQPARAPVETAITSIFEQWMGLLCEAGQTSWSTMQRAEMQNIAGMLRSEERRRDQRRARLWWRSS